MKKNIILNMISALLGITLGILCIVINGADLVKFIAICTGIVILLVATISLIQTLVNGNFKSVDFIVALVIIAIMITVGVLLICIPGAVMFYIAGALLLVMPVVRIIVNHHHYAQFKDELPTLILGTVIVVLGLGETIDVLFIILGIVLIALSALSLVYYILVLISASKIQKASSAEENSAIEVVEEKQGE